MLYDSVLLNSCNIHRFSQLNFIQPDMDSDHTYRMELYVLELYNEFGDIVPVKDLVYRSLVHDLDEVVAADLPRNIKYHDVKFLNSINRVINDLLAKSKLKKYIINDIKSAKSTGDDWDCVLRYLDAYDAFKSLIRESKIQSTIQIFECLETCNKNVEAFYNEIMVEPDLDSKIKLYFEKEQLNNRKEYETEKRKFDSCASTEKLRSGTAKEKV